MKLLVVIALGSLALAGCGRVAPLKPAAGQPLPVKPAMAQTTPDAAELLTTPAHARPERIDELMKRPEPRRADRFDLPPPTGEAPVLLETDEPAEDQTRISTPQ
jgi:hypothetical protein